MRLPDPLLEHDQVRKPAKRAGREPVILWVRFPLWSLKQDPVVQRRRRLADIQESAGSIPAGITCDNWSVSVVAARRCGKAEDRVQSPDGPLDKWACMPMGASWVCTLTAMGSTPMRSTKYKRADRPTGRHRPGVAGIRVRFPVGPLTYIRKVAGYGLPGRTANACHQTGDEGSNPLPSAYGSMVKRTSCLASNEMFQVQILVGLLIAKKTEGQPDWRRDPVGSRLSLTALRVRFPLLPLRTLWCPWCTR